MTGEGAPLDAAVMGYTSLDSPLRADGLPAPGLTAILRDSPDAAPRWGGCGPNVAVGLRRLGLRAGLIGALGDDALSARYRRYLDEEGVDTDALVAVPGGSAPRALMLSSADGASACLYYPGASGDLGDAEAQGRLLDRARRLVLTVGPAALTERLLAMARRRGLEVAWGAKADAMAYPPELLRALIPACAVVVLNSAELAFLGDHLGVAGPDDLRRLGVGVVVLTRGAEGCEVWSREGTLRQPPVPPARVVDTTGSGDALTSAFLAAYWRTGDVALAARWGAANAASVLAHAGSQPGLCTESAIERALAAPASMGTMGAGHGGEPVARHRSRGGVG